MFRLLHTDTASRARAGLLQTDRGVVHTPIFMPVGTQGTVKAIEQRELQELGAEIILGNTYHLYLRPGESGLQHFGGLHRFMQWDKPILTDSGGFQVYSLKDLRKITEDGVRFKSHLDGSEHFFSPERVIDIQRAIGSDIMMSFDECTPYPCEKDYAAKSMRLSMRWAKRGADRWRETLPQYEAEQFLFGIVQGSVYKELRLESIEKLREIDFPGYSIGGLAVGESAETMYEVIEWCTDVLPQHKPRYLMGVGTPENILEAIERGVDMFDCVMPTRNGRNGQIFTTRGRVNILNNKYKLDDSPLDEGLDTYAAGFSKGYLRHLFKADEVLALQIASMQNIGFYLWLTKTARRHILEGTFTAWKRAFLEQYNQQTL